MTSRLYFPLNEKTVNNRIYTNQLFDKVVNKKFPLFIEESIPYFRPIPIDPIIGEVYNFRILQNYLTFDILPKGTIHKSTLFSIIIIANNIDYYGTIDIDKVIGFSPIFIFDEKSEKIYEPYIKQLEKFKSKQLELFGEYQ